ncbi:hypothetical protein Bca4012_073641 [Brassica carinata]
MQLICLLIDWLLELGKVVKKQMEDMLKASKVILCMMYSSLAECHEFSNEMSL